MRLESLALLLGAELVGNGDVEIDEAKGACDCGENHIALALDRDYLKAAVASGARAVIIPPGLCPGTMPALVVDNPKLAWAKAIHILTPADKALAYRSHLAYIADDAVLGEEVYIGHFAVVESRARVGKGSRVFPHAYIGPHAVIGDDCTICPGATVLNHTEIGDRTVVHSGAVVGSDGFGYVWDGHRYFRIPHRGCVSIGDEVEIGANSCIDRATTAATVVGSGTKIDNLCQIGHNAKIAENCVIAGMSGVGGSSELEAGVVMAGMAGVGDHVSVKEGASLGAGAIATSDLPGQGLFLGVPARPGILHLKATAALYRVSELLPEIERMLADVRSRRGEKPQLPTDREQAQH